MTLLESTQDEVIETFQNVLNQYKALKNACSKFIEVCKGDKDLEFDSEYLNDFCSEELKKKIDGVKDSILDKYFPIEDGDEEVDYVKAGEIYHNSITRREQVFDD